MKAMQTSTQHAHIKYMFRVSKKELMRPQTVIPLNYCGDYEHLPPAYHAHPNIKADSWILRIHLYMIGIIVYNRI